MFVGIFIIITTTHALFGITGLVSTVSEFVKEKHKDIIMGKK